MLITISQIVIFVCVILFIISNLLAIYFFAETFTVKKIKLKNPSIAWDVITNIHNFNLWWDKLNQTNLNTNRINILDHSNLTHFKFTISEKDDVKEIWTFYLLNKSNDSILYIKKQSLSNSNYVNFINKYIKNKQDLNLYSKNLNQALIKVSI